MMNPLSGRKDGRFSMKLDYDVFEGEVYSWRRPRILKEAFGAAAARDACGLSDQGIAFHVVNETDRSVIADFDFFVWKRVSFGMAI